MANRLVERCRLPAKRPLEMLGLPQTTFCRWCGRDQAFGGASQSAIGPKTMARGPDERRPHPGRVWNRVPGDMREAMADLALQKPELSPRELAVRFPDTKKDVVSEGETDLNSIR